MDLRRVMVDGRRRVVVALVLTVAVAFGLVAIATRGGEPTQQLTAGDTEEATPGTSEPDPTTTTASPEPPTTGPPATTAVRAPATTLASAVPTTTTTEAGPKVTLLDGEQITYFDGQGRLMAMSVDGKQTKELLGPRTCACWDPPRWSPDGTRAAFGGMV